MPLLETIAWPMTARSFRARGDLVAGGYELIDGRPVDRRPVLRRHDEVAERVARLLEPFAASGARLLRGAWLAANEISLLRPDLLLTGPEGEPERPRLLVEVGDSVSDGYDMWDKRRIYETLPDPVEHWHIASHQRWVQVWQRLGASGWLCHTASGSGSFRSAALDGMVALDQIYGGLDLGVWEEVRSRHADVTAPPGRMRLDEFLTWEDGTDRRWELICGSPRMRPGEVALHGALVGDICCALDEARKPGTIALAGGNFDCGDETMLMADLALIECAVAGDQVLVDVPALVLEVTSPASEPFDRHVKLPRYRRCPHVREIWLVACEREEIETHSRSEQGWARASHGPEDAIPSRFLAAPARVAALYEDIRRWRQA